MIMRHRMGYSGFMVCLVYTGDSQVTAESPKRLNYVLFEPLATAYQAAMNDFPSHSGPYKSIQVVLSSIELPSQRCAPPSLRAVLCPFTQSGPPCSLTNADKGHSFFLHDHEGSIDVFNHLHTQSRVLVRPGRERRWREEKGRDRRLRGEMTAIQYPSLLERHKKKQRRLTAAGPLTFSVREPPL